MGQEEARDRRQKSFSEPSDLKLFKLQRLSNVKFWLRYKKLVITAIDWSP